MRPALLTVIWAFTAPPATFAPVHVSHAPLQPGPHEQVEVCAQGPAGSALKISYEVFPVVAGGGIAAAPSLTGVAAICAADDPPGTCAHRDLPGRACVGHIPETATAANGLIRVAAEGAVPDGPTQRESYLFAGAGYDRTGAVPLRFTGAQARRFDVVLVPEVVPTPALLEKLRRVIQDGYFGGVVTDLISGHPDSFNFWYSPEPGTYEENCRFNAPSALPRFGAWADIIHYLHEDEMRDCYYDRQMSSEIDSYPSLAHEAGHALFGLQDEYCCDTNYSPRANLWASLAQCQADAAAIGYPNDACRQLSQNGQSVDFWRIDPDDCKMHDTAGNDFGRACRRAALTRYTQLGSAEPPAGGPAAAGEPRLQPVAYRLEAATQEPAAAVASRSEVEDFNSDLRERRDSLPMLVVRLKVSERKLEASHVAIQNVDPASRPDPETSAGRSLTLKAMDQGGSVILAFRLPDPLWAELDGKAVRLPQGETTVRLPIDAPIDRLVMEAPGKPRTSRSFPIFGSSEPATVTLRNVPDLLKTACTQRTDVQTCALTLAGK